MMKFQSVIVFSEIPFLLWFLLMCIFSGSYGCECNCHCAPTVLYRIQGCGTDDTYSCTRLANGSLTCDAVDHSNGGGQPCITQTLPPIVPPTTTTTTTTAPPPTTTRPTTPIPCGSTDWILFQGTCYFFAKAPLSLDRTPWSEANRFCNNVSPGAKLAEFVTQNEFDFARTTCLSVYGVTPSVATLVWVNARTVNSRYAWVPSGSEVTVNGWAPGQPETFNDKCVFMLSSDSYLMHDYFCSDLTKSFPKVGYICEKSP